jgi:hypothetical protein
MITIKHPPKMTRDILEYAKDLGAFTPNGFRVATRGYWNDRSTKSRINEMVNLGLLVRLSEGQERRGIESQFQITDEGEKRLFDYEMACDPVNP